RAAGDAARAFELALTAAAVEERRGALRSAIERYRKLAEAAPDHPKAPQTHLQAAWATARLAGAQSEEYIELLKEHLRCWPKANTADDARLWLGRAHQARSEWEAAAALYREVRPEAAGHAEAVQHLHVCVQRVLQQMRADKKPYEEFARSAIEHFDQLVTGEEGRWPDRLTAAQREAVVAAGSLRLEYVSGAEAAAEQQLRPAVKLTDGSTASWQSAVRVLLVRSLVGQEKFDAAKEEVGRAADAVRQWKTWADKRSGDARAQRTYGELLLAIGDAEALRLALERWRFVERRTPPGATEWFRAKYWIAICHERLGDKQQAARVVTVLAELHPELGGPALKGKFESLRKRCEQIRD
ncbi:MAG: tetratricopeptide repeat protein, partial [Pirellulales bacterium]